MAAEGFSFDSQAAKRKTLKLDFEFGASPAPSSCVPVAVAVPVAPSIQMPPAPVPPPLTPPQTMGQTLASMGHPTQMFAGSVQREASPRSPAPCPRNGREPCSTNNLLQKEAQVCSYAPATAVARSRPARSAYDDVGGSSQSTVAPGDAESGPLAPKREGRLGSPTGPSSPSHRARREARLRFSPTHAASTVEAQWSPSSRARRDVGPSSPPHQTQTDPHCSPAGRVRREARLWSLANTAAGDGATPSSPLGRARREAAQNSPAHRESLAGRRSPPSLFVREVLSNAPGRVGRRDPVHDSPASLAASREAPLHFQHRQAVHGSPAHMVDRQAIHGSPAHMADRQAVPGSPAHMADRQAVHGSPAHMVDREAIYNEDVDAIRSSEAPTDRQDIHGSPAHMTDRQATHGLPAHMTDRQATHGLPAHMADRQVIHGSPAHMADGQVIHGSPAHMTDRQVIHGSPAHMADGQVIHGSPAHMADGQVIHGSPAHMTDRQVIHGSPAHMADGQVIHGSPAHMADGQVIHGSPAHMADGQVIHGSPAHMTDRQAIHGSPAHMTDRQVIHGSPAHMTDGQVIHGSPAYMADKQVVHGSPAHVADGQVIHGSPAYMADGQVIHGSPAHMADRQVIQGSPAHMADREVIHGSPAHMADGKVIHDSPAHMADRQAIHGSPAHMANRETIHNEDVDAIRSSEAPTTTREALARLEGVMRSCQDHIATREVCQGSPVAQALPGSPSLVPRRQEAGSCSPAIRARREAILRSLAHMCPRDVAPGSPRREPHLGSPARIVRNHQHSGSPAHSRNGRDVSLSSPAHMARLHAEHAPCSPSSRSRRETRLGSLTDSVLSDNGPYSPATRAKRELLANSMAHLGDRDAGVTVAPPSSPRLHCCADCGRSFTSRSALREHAKRHRPVQQTFICCVCGQVFSTKGELTEHGGLHCLQFRCVQCQPPLQYSNLNALKKHQFLIHTTDDAPPFVCPEQPRHSHPAQKKLAPRERLRSHSLESTGKLQISPEQTFDFTAEDLTDHGEIGRGNYGTVNKMYHEHSDTVMAVKRIRSTVDEREQKQLLMDLDVVMRSNDCPCIVQFYGALFKEGDCWICMELMSISLDKFYKFLHGIEQRLPEAIIGKISLATVKALSYLKEKLKIIHRDVKPSNILLDKSGNIKLCDFGISGQLVDSIAKTRDAGCRPYMAPERIDPWKAPKGYDVRSDVWSLGITLIEIATGKFPYPKWNSVFDQLTQVVQGDPPQLTDGDDQFSQDFRSFVNICLTKDREHRPKYNRLLKHSFIRAAEELEIDVAEYITRVLDAMPEDMSQLEGSNS